LFNQTFFSQITKKIHYKITFKNNQNRFIEAEYPSCHPTNSINALNGTQSTDANQKQEGLAVASIAQDDPSPLPGMHRDHNALPSQTDGQTDRQTLTS